MQLFLVANCKRLLSDRLILQKLWFNVSHCQEISCVFSSPAIYLLYHVRACWHVKIKTKLVSCFISCARSLYFSFYHMIMNHFEVVIACCSNLLIFDWYFRLVLSKASLKVLEKKKTNTLELVKLTELIMTLRY